MSGEGLITVSSPHPVKLTADRLEADIRRRSLTLFARIDHAGGAASVGMELRPTELLVFGHPKGGTPLMQSRQTAGLDLPLRVLAWEDEAAHVWLTYDDPAWIARRHGVEGEAAVTALAALLEGLVETVRGA